VDGPWRDRMEWTGLVWLRIWIAEGLLWMR
jgi:hypothetical protein